MGAGALPGVARARAHGGPARRPVGAVAGGGVGAAGGGIHDPDGPRGHAYFPGGHRVGAAGGGLEGVRPGRRTERGAGQGVPRGTHIFFAAKSGFRDRLDRTPTAVSYSPATVEDPRTDVG